MVEYFTFASSFKQGYRSCISGGFGQILFSVMRNAVGCVSPLFNKKLLGLFFFFALALEINKTVADAAFREDVFGVTGIFF